LLRLLTGSEIQVPRDRQGEFEPVVLKKHQSNVTGIEDQIILSASDSVLASTVDKNHNI
jgi:putative transposase